MWPFGSFKPGNAISDDTGPERQKSPVAGPSHAMGVLATTEDALQGVSDIDLGMVKSVLTQAQTLGQRLEAFVDDLTSSASSDPGSLDTYSGNIEAAYARLKSTVGGSADVIVRRFKIGRERPLPALLAFVDGLADSQMVDQDTILLMQRFKDAETLSKNPPQAYTLIQESVIAVGHATVKTQWSQLLVDLMGGNTLVFIGDCPQVLVLDTIKYPARSISNPTTERAVKGPQEAFNEVVLTQMNLIRRRIKSPSLRFDSMKVGILSQTTVIIAYIQGLTNPELIEAVRRRLSTMNVATVEYANTVADGLISSRSLFPQVRSTERVDMAVRALSLGKVAVLVDNTPYVLILPSTFMDFYQTTDDYTVGFWQASLERIIRLLGLFIGLMLPAFYVALTSVDPELLPTKLVITIAGSRVGIPYPPIVEVAIMWITIEILREAAIRLPKGLSTTLGTVGAIVVGTAVVKAGLVSDIMIVIITLNALALFTSPVYEMATPWRILFWVVVLAAYFLGIYGIILSALAILAHLASLENFGVPYLSPFGPLRIRDLKDSWIRAPKDTLVFRPAYLRTLHPIKRIPHPHKPMAHPQLHQTQKEYWHDEE